MYTHFARLHPTNTDSNGDKVILFLWSHWQNYTQGADDVIINASAPKRNARFQDYVTNYNASLRYVWDATETDIVVYLKTLAELKTERRDLIGLDYLEDVIWTDHIFWYYDKLVQLSMNTAAHDTWFDKIKAYWQEARNERDSNKTDISEALNEAGVNAVSYTPTHVEDREDIEDFD